MKFLAASQDKTVINLLCSEFKHLGYTTYGAQSLKELEIVQNHEKCDVIVSDHLFQDGNFFDYYDQLKTQLKKDLPVAIILTNPQEKMTSDVSIAMGAYAVFNKPFDLKNLYEAVENATFARREGLMRRIDERVPLVCRLEYKLKIEQNWYSGFSNNISFGGFFAVATEHIPEIGEEISFRLQFTQAQSIEGVAKVMWCRKTPKNGEQMGFGVNFTEGREKYVNFLVPLLNEARTRQIETSIFQNENIFDILEQSIQLAKIKIAKSKMNFTIKNNSKKILIMCRFPKLLQAFSELFIQIASPLRELDNSQCRVEVTEKPGKIIVTIMDEPGGTSLDTETVLHQTVMPILDSHKAKITTHFSSVYSSYVISFPCLKKPAAKH